MYSDDKPTAANTPANTDTGRSIPVYERILELFEAEGVKAVFGIPDPNFVHLFVAAEQRGWKRPSPPIPRPWRNAHATAYPSSGP